MIKPFKISLIILLLFLISCSTKDSRQGTDQLKFSQIQLETLDEELIDLSLQKEKIIFINFWATWCKPCMAEIPTIEAAMKKLNDSKVIFILASTESVEKIESFKNKHNFNFYYTRLLNMEELGIVVLPTTFIFNSERELIFSESGYRDWSTEESLNLIMNK